MWSYCYCTHEAKETKTQTASIINASLSKTVKGNTNRMIYTASKLFHKQKKKENIVRFGWQRGSYRVGEGKEEGVKALRQQ